MKIDLRDVRKLAYHLEEKGKIKIISISENGSKIYKYKIIQSKKHDEFSLAQLQERLRFEKENLFFSCSRHKYTYREAIESDFKCPKCEVLLTSYDNLALIQAIEKAISKILIYQEA